MLKVYIWHPSPGRTFGHFALKLTDGTYLSFWPQTNFSVGDALSMASKPSMWNPSSSEDRRFEKRAQDVEIDIVNTNVDEKKILEFWKVKEAQNKEFNLKNNCATMTLNLLEAGGLNDNDNDYKTVKAHIFNAMMTIMDNLVNARKQN